MATISITVQDVKPIQGFDKGCHVHFVADGNNLTSIAKAWKDPEWVIGQKYTVTTEKKKRPGYSDENWINQPKKTGFGGGGKADPEKLKLERERLEHEKAKSASYVEEKHVDRALEIRRQAGIMAQFCINSAVELEAANISKAKAETTADINLVSQYAQDIADLLPQLHEQIEASLKARSGNRQ